MSREISGIGATLADGTEIRLDSMGACDKQCFADAFDGLSDRTRYSRYHAPIKRLPDSYLESLVQADNRNSVVVVAHIADGDSQEGAGMARYVCLKDEPNVAEFSLTIADNFQGRGLGGILLNHLVQHARSNDVFTLRGYVISDNKPMLKLLEKYSCSIERESDGTYCYEIDTTAALADRSEPDAV